MLSVFIVEDELFAREMIRDFIQWGEMGLELVGEASNGAEAFETIRTIRPDIVICDIVMPVMNGVELLERVRKSGIESRFIMLTCVNEFDYVRQALEFGASSYILKLSMSVKSLREALEKVKRECETKIGYGEAEIEQYYDNLWKRFRDPQLEVSEPPLHQPGVYRLSIFGCLAGSSDAPAATTLLERLQPRANHIHVFARMGLVSVFCWSRDPLTIATLGMNENMSYVLNVRPEEIEEAWRCVIRAADKFWYGEETGMQRAAACRGESSRNYRFWDTERKLIWHFEQGKTDACLALFEQLWDDLRRQQIPMRTIKEFVVSLDWTFQRIVGAVPGESVDDLETSTSHADLKQQFTNRMIRHGQSRLAHRNRHINHPQIVHLIQYIEQNYDRDLTVKSLAKMVHMDETYVSNLFKKKTGMTIIKYIHQVRIERSKLLLHQSDMTIAEVGESVGFMDNNYFNRIFRRYVGTTPGNYRRQISLKS